MKVRVFLPLLFILTACGGGKVDTSKVQEEMRAREIRLIPEAKIIERTLAIGDSLIKTLDPKTALSNAGEVVKTWKISNATFSGRAYDLTGNYDLLEKEAGVFEAYKYNAANALGADPNAQKLSVDIIAYNAPIAIDGKTVGMWSLHLPRNYVVLSIQE